MNATVPEPFSFPSQRPDDAHDRVSEFIHYALPLLAMAGRYSTHIQRQVQAHAAKPGDNVFAQALTDADLSVQAFLEVALLARFPDFAFFSEEYAASLNAKYFPAVASFEALLDPIDGTRAYLEGADRYQIILSLRENSRLVAVLCHMPRLQHCYVAVRNRGATRCAMDNMLRGNPQGSPVRLSDGSRRVIVFKAPKVKRRLSSEFEVIDIFEEHARSGIHRGFTEILEGQAAACIHPDPQLIDAAAIAFIAEQAGGVLTDFSGKPLAFDHVPTERGPGLVVSATPSFHREIIARLA